jgi:TetR/AcrR family transcriptional regulator, transcriptional repressor for nem operon
MARPREFERDDALQQAIRVFCDKGYAAASTDELMRAMRISRQSMYNTFGDKRQLYMEALRRYHADSVSDLIHRLGEAASALAGLENALLAFASRPEFEGTTGCMGVNAICEFGHTEPEIALLGEASANTLMSALERTLRDARLQGEVDPLVDDKLAARYLLSTLSGMKISAKAGATPQDLRDIAHFALRSLRASTDHSTAESVGA